MPADRPRLGTRLRAAAEARVDAVTTRYPSTAMGIELYERFRRRHGNILAGHIAYRLFVWLLPCALVLVTIAGFITDSGGDPAATMQAGQDMALGEALTSSLRSAGQDAARDWWKVALIAGVGVVVGGLGLLSGLYYAFAQIWDVPATHIEAKGRRLAQFIAGFVVLVVAIAIARAMRQAGLVQSLMSYLGLIALMASALFALGLLLPHRCREWYWLVPGAVVGAGLFAALQEFATVYLPTKVGSLSATYGALGVAVVALSYLYLFALIVVSSAFVNATWYDNRMRARAGDPGAGAASPVPPPRDGDVSPADQAG